MKTKFLTPKHLKNRWRLITAAVIVLMSGVMLLGTIKFIGATQTDAPACEQQFKRECLSRKEAPKPGLICPNPRQPCPLETTHSRENNKLEQEGTLDE